MKSRLQNYALWVSLFAFIPILAVSLMDYNIHLILPGNYDKLVLAVLGLLNLLGLINNPTTANKWFGDDKKAE